MAQSPEVQQGNGGEHLRGASEAAAEQLEKLKGIETAGEQSPEQQAERAEKARVEASKEALMSQEAGKESKGGGEPSALPKRKVITKKDRSASYKQTMSRVQQEMNPGQRAFSRVIHSPAIERTSEVLGKTIARPNAILAGAFTAFVVVTFLYFYARNQGFQLSGFEAIGAFAVGWLAGILFDFFRTMITGKKV